MSDTTLVHLQSCLDRLQAGDATARDDLIRMSYHRLDALVRKMVKKDDRVAAWEQAEDVLQNATLRLWKSLDHVKPATVGEFLGLAATQIRRELIDLARHYFGQQGAGQHELAPGVAGGDQSMARPFEGVETTYDPSRLAAWTEFHRMVEALPADERQLCEMLWYLGLPQDEVAGFLGVDVSTVKRRWRAVRLKLHRIVKEWDGAE
ncbi:MAG: sigma-70 family RNA polymerase sigma factor [Isosphaeraceae bacterium]|nr:sigma-70 family RNA polymerase sigma factor [Isosphaeraceae bacterium]